MSDDDNRIPIEQVLPGMGLHPLPEKWSPIEAYVMVKCVDEDGDASWLYRTTAPPNRQELLGVLVTQTDLLRKELLAEWEEEED